MAVDEQTIDYESTSVRNNLFNNTSGSSHNSSIKNMKGIFDDFWNINILINKKTLLIIKLVCMEFYVNVIWISCSMYFNVVMNYV